MTILISHIPKTAGSSLRMAVSKSCDYVGWIDNGELSLLRPDLEFCLNFKKTAPPSVLIGHFSYGVHRFLGLEPRYVTCMRVPEERIISFYRYHKCRADSPFFEAINSGLSLKNFLEQIETETTNNHACRMVAGIPPDAGLFIDEEWLLDLAIYNIERHYLIVGSLERIDLFYRKLFLMMGWSELPMPRENISKGPNIHCDAETMRVIQKRNRLDIKLYEYVSKKFSKD